MPELPEVEIIKRELNDKIMNRNILSVHTSSYKLHGKPIPDLNLMIGESFNSIYRRNKYLILETSHYFLVIHLGMTGQLIFDKQLPDNQKHIHAVFVFESSYLYYQDVRRFGSINLYSKSQYNDYLNIPLFNKLGYEPLEAHFTLDNFSQCVRKSTQHAKAFLMNSEFVCGIGNIYANEILFLTNINPEKRINTLNKKQISLMYQNIINILNQAILLGGSSISDFVHLNGSSGNMQNHYYVYGRYKEPCKICYTNIDKIKQNGRSTFFCPKCQKK